MLVKYSIHDSTAELFFYAFCMIVNSSDFILCVLGIRKLLALSGLKTVNSSLVATSGPLTSRVPTQFFEW